MREDRSGRRPLRGVTLVELLVAMSILSILGAMLVVVLQGGVTTWRRGEGRCESLDVAQVVFAQLASDLDAATVDVAESHGGAAGPDAGTRFLGTQDRAGRSVLRLVRTIRGESENTITGSAGSVVGGEGRIDGRNDMKKALAGELRATGGLMEVAYFMGAPGGPDALVLYRGVRSPVGGAASFLASEKNLLGTPQAGMPDGPGREGLARAHALASRVLSFELLYAGPATTTWSPGEGAGPAPSWDGMGAGARRPALPGRVKATLVLREGAASESATTLASGTSETDLSFAVLEPERLVPTGGLVWIDGECIAYDGLLGPRVLVSARGVRGTRPARHESEAAVLIGRTFEAVLRVPGARL